MIDSTVFLIVSIRHSIVSLNVALGPYHTDMEDIEVKVKCSAHHEAGHIVIAAVQGLRLRSEGLMVDRTGEGLACYFRETTARESELS